ncbi:MAG: hypothetical protein B7Y48_07650 [Methylophilales bacterium 28-44-11]|nr:MAG: hypothetical protein B7Y48_07650 [Methylophilales bacterium 28-44-11]
MNSLSNLLVGSRIEVTSPWLSGGLYTIGSLGVIVNKDRDNSGADIKFDDGKFALLRADEFEAETPKTPLELAKGNLAKTQAAYDEACAILDSAKAAFKLADEAHGKAIEAHDKEARKFTEADVKNFMTVKVRGHNELRIMHITDEDIRFYEANGRIANRTSRDFLINCLNRNYEKTDLTISA